MRKILKLLKRKEGIVIVVFGMLSAIFGSLFPYFLGKATTLSEDFTKSILLALFFGGMGTVFQYISTVQGGTVSAKYQRELEEKIYRKILNCQIKEMNSTSKGEISQMFASDIFNITEGALLGLSTIVQGVTVVCSTIFMMMILSPSMAILVGIATPISIFVTGYIAKKIQKYVKKERALQGDCYDFLTERLSTIEEIKRISAVEGSIEELKQITARLEMQSKKANLFTSLINPTQRILNNMIYIAVGVFGIISMFSIGQMVTFLIYTNQFSKPFLDISAVMTVLQKANSSYDVIEKFLKMEEIQRSGTNVDPSFEYAVEMENVDFSFGDSPFIENLNFKIRKGEKVAIVGDSGGGKTTICNLIMGFYEEYKGNIKIFGKELKTISKVSLWDSISMVNQEPFVFEGSMEKNLNLKKTHSGDKILEIVNKCQIHMDKGGIFEEISPRDMSTGQKQLVEVAREMLESADIVILDEATSSLDSLTELKITNAYATLLENTTSIVIAHRLSTIKESDLILAVKDGKILEQGTFSELIEKNGYFKKLYDSRL